MNQQSSNVNPGGGGRSPKLDENGLPAGMTIDPAWEVTPRQVKAMLDADADFVLLDCRTAGERATAKIEKTIFLSLQELPSKMGDLELFADEPIIIHCHHGRRSMQMAHVLRGQGYNVKSMAGGIDLWSIDIDPSVPRY
jgi:rhodanese-related sulfurtransferase